MWLVLVLVLVAAGAGAFLALGGTGKTTVPPLQGLHRASVLERTSRAHVQRGVRVALLARPGGSGDRPDPRPRGHA